MKKIIKPSILSISLLTIMTSSTISPALSKISYAFPNTDDYIIKLILTIPSLVLIPFSIISGRISHLISKRKIVISGLLIYLIGGVGGGFSVDINTLIFFRVIIGIGIGIILPFSRSLIADFYEGDERITLMGISNSIANLGAILTALISGLLASINWRLVFSIYFIAVPILILIIIGLPEPKIQTNTKKQIINKSVIFIALFGIFINILFYSVMTNISFFIENENIGNSESSGIAISALTFAGFLSGLLLQKICKLFKSFKVSVTILIMSLGFFTLNIATSIYIVLLGTFFVGFGMGFIKPLLFLKVIDVTPKFSNSFSLSLMSSSLYLGKFLSPLFFDLLKMITYNFDYRFIFKFAYISLFIFSIISLISNIDFIKTFVSNFKKKVKLNFLKDY